MLNIKGGFDVNTLQESHIFVKQLWVVVMVYNLFENLFELSFIFFINGVVIFMYMGPIFSFEIVNKYIPMICQFKLYSILWLFYFVPPYMTFSS